MAQLVPIDDLPVSTRPTPVPVDDLPAMISTMKPEPKRAPMPSYQELGIRPEEVPYEPSVPKPTTAEVLHGMATETKGAIEAPMMAAIGMGLATHPIGVLAGLGTFMGIEEAVNLGVSLKKGKPYQIQGGQGIAELVDAQGLSKDAIDLAEVTGAMILSGGAAAGGKVGFAKFGELVRGLKGKEKVDFINEVAKDVKEQGKTPDEIIETKGPGPIPSRELIPDKRLVPESDLPSPEPRLSGEATFTPTEGKVLAEIPDRFEDIPTNKAAITAKATGDIDTLHSEAWRYDDAKSFRKAMAEKSDDPDGTWDAIGAKSARDFWEQAKRTPPKEMPTEGDLTKYGFVKEGAAPEAVWDSTTSIKNAVTTAERAERGLPEVEREIRRTVPMFEEGKRLVESGERDPRALAQELVDKPRTHTPEEAAMLLYDRMRIKNEHKASMEVVEKAIDAGDTIAEAEARVRLKAVEDAYSVNDTAARQSGTEWSAAGRMRQLTIKEDYSLAELVRRYKVETGKAEVPPDMRTKLESFSKQIEELNEKLKVSEEGKARLLADRAVERVKEEVKRETRKTIRAASKQDLSVEFDVLNKELNKLLGGRLSSGLDPEAVIILGRMAKNRVKSGIITVEGIVDSIHSSIKDMGFELSKRDIRDAISGYGVTAQMSKEAIAVQLREVKRQMRLISAYEDATSGKAPLRSGLQRDLPSNTVRELTRKVQEMVREQGIDLKEGRTPEEKWRTALQSYKTRMTHQIADFEKKLATGDFTKKEKRITELDPEALDLQFKRDKVIRQYHEAMLKDKLSRRNLPQRVGAGIAESMNLVRALKTSFDLSAVLRQGGFVFLGHPIRGIKAMPSMFKALASDKGRFAVEQEILSRPNYRLYEQSKLYLSEHGQKLSQMEEAYMSRWAEKIPGIAASQRAYTTYLNRLRADSFDSMLKTLVAEEGKPTRVEIDAISNFINVVTGRGSFRGTQNALVGLNTAFFAPRYVASRFQMLAGQPFYKGTARTRYLMAYEYARFFAGISTLYSLGMAAGAKVEIDPRSSDFGKIKFGNVRVDPLLGLSQVTTLVGRLISGETKKSKGQIVPIRGEKVPYGGANSADVVASFLRSKLSPVVGLGLDVAVGKDVVGQPVKAQGMPEKLLMPLAFNDIYESMKEMGVPAASALAVLSIFGMGLQTYDPNKRTR